MKRTKLFFATMLVAAVAVSFTACDPNGDPEDPFKPGGDKPVTALTVAEAIAQQGASGEKTVQGYVVGWFNTKPNPGVCVFNADNAVDTTVNQANVLLADAADVTDPAAVVCVQLPAGAVRDLMNLGSNKANLGKLAIVKGLLTTYNLLPGVKTTSYAEIDGKKSSDPQSELLCYRTKDGVVSGSALKAGDVVVVKTVLVNFKGTLEANYGYFTAINGTVPAGAITAAEALTQAAALQQTTDAKTDYHPSDSVFVTGTVTRIKDTYSTEYKNISYYIN